MEEKELSNLFINEQGLCLDGQDENGDDILYNIVGFDTPSVFFGESFLAIRLEDKK